MCLSHNFVLAMGEEERRDRREADNVQARQSEATQAQQCQSAMSCQGPNLGP